MSALFILFISTGLLGAAYCMHRSIEAHYKAQRSLFMAHIDLIKMSAGIKDDEP